MQSSHPCPCQQFLVCLRSAIQSIATQRRSPHPETPAPTIFPPPVTARQPGLPGVIGPGVHARIPLAGPWSYWGVSNRSQPVPGKSRCLQAHKLRIWPYSLPGLPEMGSAPGGQAPVAWVFFAERVSCQSDYLPRQREFAWMRQAGGVAPGPPGG